MDAFIRKHGDSINGVLAGFDRLVFRGTLRTLSHADGMKLYLSRAGVLLKEFGAHVQALSERVKQATEATALSMGLFGLAAHGQGGVGAAACGGAGHLGGPGLHLEFGGGVPQL